MHVIGIDPGNTGAAVAIYSNRSIFVCRFGQAVNVEIFAFLAQHRTPATFMENVGARRGDFTPQLASFMRHTGMIDGFVIASGTLGVEYVEPKAWQYEFNLGGKHGPLGCSDDQEYRARKKAHHAKAQELFVIDANFNITRDLADAMLIAEYGYRKTFGGITNGKEGKAQRQGEGIRWETARPRGSQV